MPLSPTVGYFNPLPPYGGRLATARNTAQHGYFNPLPPYGGRHISNATTQQDKLFQSTPSVWRETFLPRFSAFVAVISIHSLRMEGDVRYDHRQSAVRDFNPLPPYGGRHMGELIKQVAPNISIHSLRMEGDLSSRVSIDRTQNFNPLPPYGGRLASDRNDVRSRHFNPLPPYGGRPWIEMPTCTHLSKFQSTPSVWRETPHSIPFPDIVGISIHSLRMEGDFSYTRAV